MLCAMGFRRMKAMVGIMNVLEEKRKKHAPNAIHLQCVGVDPEHQGKGLGRQVVMGFIEKADADGVPTYLESGNARNVPFYSKLGFQVVEELYPCENKVDGNGNKVEGKGPVTTLMLR